ncbi:hypothetical protein P7K49_013356, partial [Saguinus oedipus]
SATVSRPEKGHSTEQLLGTQEPGRCCTIQDSLLRHRSSLERPTGCQLRMVSANHPSTT